MVENELVVHPDYRLGKRKPDPTKPRLRLANFLSGTPPQVPAAADHFSKVPQWGLYRNNEWGICGPTALANSRRLITQAATGTMDAPPQGDVTDLYTRVSGFNPATGANDDGVILQDMLTEAVKNGLGSHKPLGFAEVDHTNIDEMMAAIAIFGFLIIGVDLRTPQQSQTNQRLWEHVDAGGDWGGHAILGGRYTNPDGTLADRTGVVTWAMLVDMTDNFINRQLDEAWVVIWPEHLRDSAFLEGMDVPAFALAYKNITGRDFPATIPPAPQPTPGGGENFQLNLGADAQVVTHIASAASRAHITPDEWAIHHFRSYFKIR